MMRAASRTMCVVCAVALAFAVAGTMHHVWADAAGMGMMKFTAQLSGSEQVAPIQSKGTGQFQASTDASNKSISYRLTFSGLTNKVTAAHIHLGKKGANGGVAAFLCGGGGKKPCPASGTVTGTITSASVVATGDLKKGNLAGLIQAMSSGDTYVNVHTTKYKDGEIRGQIEAAK